MKTNLFLTLALGALLPLLSAQAAPARPEFEIKKIQNVAGQDAIGIGKDWRTDSPKRLKVTLRVGQAITNTSDIIVTAEFFDKDNKVVETWEKAHPIRKKEPKGFKVLTLPASLEPNQDYQVYFAIPPELNRKKWVRVVVRFGRVSGEAPYIKFSGVSQSFP